MHWALTLMALAVLGVAAVSGRLTSSPITPAILFAGFGLLVGPQVLDGIDVESSSAAVRTFGWASPRSATMRSSRRMRSAACAAAARTCQAGCATVMA